MLQSIIKAALCKTRTLLPEDTQISQLFTEHCRGRISEEIIGVLENTFDLITISSIFSEITSISQFIASTSFDYHICTSD